MSEAPDNKAPSLSWAIWAWQAFRDGRLVQTPTENAAARIADLERQLAEARDKALEEAALHIDKIALGIDSEEDDNRTWGGPDPRGREAEGIMRDVAQRYRAEAKAIRNLKGTP